MARFARVVVPRHPHHISHRGNRREDVFFCDSDREEFLADFKTCADDAGLSIWGYCLMSNHVHLIAVPRRLDSMAIGMRRAHQRHTMRINRAQGRSSGLLWGNRYFSTVLDDEHLWAAIRYVESNPVRAGLVKHAQEWTWSSARAHCDMRRRDLLLDPERPFGGSQPHPMTGTKLTWAEWLEFGLEEETLACIRQSTQTGRPCGSRRFVEKVEKKLQRNLIPQKRGPKPEKDNQNDSDQLKLF